MEVSNPRDDRAERNRGSAEVPLSRVIQRVGNFHLEQNTILDSFSCTTPPKIWFISRFCVFFSLGENTWVRCNFITQAKSVAISVWCARTKFPYHFISHNTAIVVWDLNSCSTVVHKLYALKKKKKKKKKKQLKTSNQICFQRN